MKSRNSNLKKLCFFLWSFLFILIIFELYPSFAEDHRVKWNVVQFEMDWEKGKAPKWYMGPLLAKEIFAPIIYKYKGDIKLWRFHRRASRDKSGHQFSFIFFAKKNAAELIFREVQEISLLNELSEKKYIIRENYISTEKFEEGEYSDPHWSSEMQAAWPEYAMGFSKLWLRLIFIYDTELPMGKNMIEHYMRVEEKLSGEWRNSATHAFFHHVHAMFAYVKS